MNDQGHWQAPQLQPEDQELIDAYVNIGVVVDELPHTEAISRLVAKLGRQDTDAVKHTVFKRLLRLRKMGRLPRLPSTSAA